MKINNIKQLKCIPDAPTATCCICGLCAGTKACCCSCCCCCCCCCSATCCICCCCCCTAWACALASICCLLISLMSTFCLMNSCPLSRFSRVLATSYLQSSAVMSVMPAFWARVSRHCSDRLPCCWLLLTVSFCWVDSGSWLSLDFCCFGGVLVASFSGCFCCCCCWLSACWRLS